MTLLALSVALGLSLPVAVSLGAGGGGSPDREDRDDGKNETEDDEERDDDSGDDDERDPKDTEGGKDKDRDDEDGRGDDEDDRGDDEDDRGDDEDDRGHDEDDRGDDEDDRGDDEDGRGDDEDGRGDDEDGRGDDEDGRGDDEDDRGDDEDDAEDIERLVVVGGDRESTVGGAPLVYEVVAFNEDGDEVPIDSETQVVWSIAPAHGGTFQHNVLAPGNVSGNYTVKATLESDEDVWAQATLSLIDVPADAAHTIVRLEIEGGNVTTAVDGPEILFEAVGFNASGEPVPVDSATQVIWNVSSPLGGAFDGNAFTPGSVAGTYTVTGTWWANASIFAQVTITLTDPAPDDANLTQIVRLEIVGGNRTLSVSGPVVGFEVQAYNATDAIVPINSSRDVNWSVVPSSGGSFEANRFTPGPTPGAYLLRATLSSNESIASEAHLTLQAEFFGGGGGGGGGSFVAQGPVPAPSPTPPPPDEPDEAPAPTQPPLEADEAPAPEELTTSAANGTGGLGLAILGFAMVAILSIVGLFLVSPGRPIPLRIRLPTSTYQAWVQATSADSGRVLATGPLEASGHGRHGREWRWMGHAHIDRLVRLDVVYHTGEVPFAVTPAPPVGPRPLPALPEVPA